MTDFLSIINKVKPKNAVITNETYASRLRGLEARNVDFMNYPETLGKISTLFKKKTMKSCLTAISIYLQGISADPELLKTYNDGILKIGEEIVNQDNNNELNETEKENMVTRQQIRDLIKHYKSIDTLDASQRHMVLNLYYLIPPVRNDYVGTLVYMYPPKTMNTTKNYIVLSEKKFIVNRYKTAGVYGTTEIKLPKELVKIINSHMKMRRAENPTLKSRELLMNKNMVPMTQVNLTMYLNSIFGRNISSTMLRKSYLSEKYPVTHTVNDMRQDARNMMHSVATQQSTYRKK